MAGPTGQPSPASRMKERPWSRERRQDMYKLKRFGWAFIGVGLMWAGGMAQAADDPSAAGADEAQAAAQAENPHCTEAGVTVTFDKGSTAINDRGRSSLNGVAKWLDQHEGGTVKFA